MIELNKLQRQAAERGELVQATLANQNVILLRSDIYRRIQAVLEAERAIIGAGHTRGPVEPPDLLEPIPLSAEDTAALQNIVCLPASRHEELQELMVDDRLQTAWRDAVGEAQSSWAEKNPS